jgi:hypothetical protein
LEEERIKRFTGKKRDFALAGNCRGRRKRKNGYDSQGFPKKQKDGIKSGCIS